MTQIQPSFSYGAVLYHQFRFYDRVNLILEDLLEHYVASGALFDASDTKYVVNYYAVNPFTGELFIGGPDVCHFSPPIRPIRRVIQ